MKQILTKTASKKIGLLFLFDCHASSFQTVQALNKTNYIRDIQSKVLLFFFLILNNISIGQCLTAPTIPSCNPPGFISLTDNDVVAPGQIKTFNANATYNSLTMSGGTLIVCGNLTLNNITFNSGNIFIAPGACVTINPPTAIVFGSNSNIYNSGSFIIYGSIVTGANNIIYNCTPNSIFIVAFNQLVVQGLNTYIINNGIISCSYFIVQPNNSSNVVCSGPNSAITTNVLISQYADAFVSPAGPSCINIVQQIINTQSITATPNVNVCYMASNVNVIVGPNFGAATTLTNCASCSVALPLKLIGFRGNCDGETISLTWLSENEENASHYILQQSPNAIEFSDLSVIHAKHSTQLLNAYYHELNSVDYSKPPIYFRLKQFESDGSFIYSPIVALECHSDNEFELFPSANTGNYFTIGCKTGLNAISIIDAAGRIIMRKFYNNEKFISVILDQPLAAGVYLIYASDNSEKKHYRKMIVY